MVRTSFLTVLARFNGVAPVGAEASVFMGIFRKKQPGRPQRSAAPSEAGSGGTSQAVLEKKADGAGETAKADPQSALVARQPILDVNQEIYAYELLFRGELHHDSASQGDDDATIRTINTGLNVMGLDELIGGAMAFINITEGLLLSGQCEALPPKRVVVELLENIRPTPQVIEATKKVKDQGFLIALDDMVSTDGYEALLELADIVKVDYMLTEPHDRYPLIEYLHEHNITILAEKVETHEEFNEAKALGCSYFQGFFFCKPQTLSSKQITGLKLKYLHFIEQVNQPEIDFGSLEDVIKADVLLSLKLLKYLNSAAFAFRHDINSIKHALVLLGEMPVKQWAMTVALGAVAEDKPAALAGTCLTRARFCEQVGPLAAPSARTLDLFLMGMLSLADAMVDRPLQDVIGSLLLHEDVKGTLLGDENTPLAPLFKLVIAYERCDWHLVSELCGKIGLSSDDAGRIYRDAIEWADKTLESA
jgi:c-di-GMP-related signal transduction protein